MRSESPGRWSSIDQFARPRLRTSWQSINVPGSSGRFTTAETLWVVIITMGVAGMRSDVLMRCDIEWYVLHFFVLWQPVYHSIKYSARFNDHDLAHVLLWTCFTIGMVLQIAFLDHDRRGYACATCFLHMLLAAAHLRVAHGLPEARAFCYFCAAESIAAAALFGALLGLDLAHISEAPHERLLLYCSMAFDPLSTLTFRAASFAVETTNSRALAAEASEQQQSSAHSYVKASPLIPTRAGTAPPSTAGAASRPLRIRLDHKLSTTHDVIHFSMLSPSSKPQLVTLDLPPDKAYVVRKVEALHMMIVVCSFLFPLGLQGARFVASRYSALIILLGCLYALLLKSSLTDVDHSLYQLGALYDLDTSRPTYLPSRLRADLVFLGLPYVLLGVAATGVGFIAALHDANRCTPAFAVQLLSGGPALTWTTLALADALLRQQPRSDTTTATATVGKPTSIAGHRTTFLFACGFALLLPTLCELTPLSTALVAVGVQGVIFAGGVIMARSDADDSSSTTDSHATATTTGVASMTAPDDESRASLWRWRPPRLLIERAGRVTTHEHFFSVLVAVAIFSLNEGLASTHDVVTYARRWLILYALLASTMRYAARYDASDGAHALLWMAFTLIMMGIMMGLGACSGSGMGATDGWLFELAVVSQFVLMAAGFRARTAWHIPRARWELTCSGALDLAFASLVLISGMHTGAASRTTLNVAIVLTTLLSEPLLWFASARDSLGVRPSIMYIHERFKGLTMEVLGVAIIVPNARFPGSFAHPTLVLAAEVLVAVHAALLQVAIFDVAPNDEDQHALAPLTSSAPSFARSGLVNAAANHRQDESHARSVPGEDSPSKGRHGPSRGASWRSVGFLGGHAWLTLGISLVGGSLAILIGGIGAHGLAAHTPFAQATLCSASALTWAALASNRAMLSCAARVEAAGSAMAALVLLASSTCAAATSLLCLDVFVVACIWLISLGVVVVRVALASPAMVTSIAPTNLM